MSRNRLYRAAALLIPLVLFSCGRSDSGRTAETGSQAPAEEIPSLKLALLPIVDVLPFYVAGEKGYFDEEGVTVTAVPVSSALERDQLLQAGEVDGMLGEMAAAAIFNREEERLVVVMTARETYPEAPIFRIIAAPGSTLSKPQDLAGVPVAISENTIIEYITDRLLEAEGLKSDEILGQSIPAIPERFQLLMERRIQAATLPDPLAQSAVTSGAVLILDDSAHPEYAVTILAFSRESTRRSPEGVRRFLRAWSRAAADINDRPDEYRRLLLEKVRVPENVRDTFSLPPYPTGGVPSVEQWDDMVRWLTDKGLLDGASPYDRSVTAEFLPATP